MSLFLLTAGYSLSVLNMNNSVKFIVQQGSGIEDRKNDFKKMVVYIFTIFILNILKYLRPVDCKTG